MDVNVTAQTSGWAAFGLNTGASMLYGDIVVAYVDPTGIPVVTGSWTPRRRPSHRHDRVWS